MKFRTEIQIPHSPDQIDYQKKILSVGSCFAESMGKRLEEMKFQTLVNPLGIFYNPLSIGKILQKAIDRQVYFESEYADHLGEWFSFDLHGKFREAEKGRFEEQTRKAMKQLISWLPNTDWLILTFGTAFVFRKKSDGKIVANCHKFPGSLFSRDLLKVEEITGALKVVFDSLINQNPQLKIILTISPIRHIRDGLSQNNLSKSVLRLACHELATHYPFVYYFPSYEIMLDDLRDYRFYKDDFIHPTSFAEDYIWEKFVEVYVSEDAQTVMREWEKIHRDLKHRPLKADSPAYKAFLLKLREKLVGISENIDCGVEMEDVNRRLDLEML